MANMGNIWEGNVSRKEEGYYAFLSERQTLKMSFYFLFFPGKEAYFLLILITISKRILQVFIRASKFPLNPGWPVDLK